MKLLRYSNSDITVKSSELIGKRANIVYSDGRVFFGDIITIHDGFLRLKNMRLKSTTHRLTDMSEIIIDV